MCTYRHACKGWEQRARNVRKRGKEKSTQRREEEKDQKNEVGSRDQRNEGATETSQGEEAKREGGGTFIRKDGKAVRSRHSEWGDTQRKKGPQKTGRQTSTTHLHAQVLHTKSSSSSFWDFSVPSSLG